MHDYFVFEFVDLSFLEGNQEVLLRGIGYSDLLLAHASTCVIDVLNSDYTAAASWELDSSEFGVYGVISRKLSCHESSCVFLF